ncbi:MAG: AAA family ATPase [bacterium]|nr:AAA family ATPase [bacterium]MDY4100738.1 AAA family ATPase [Lachnospiraceae bacterium]
MGVYLNPGNDGFRLSVNDDIYVDKTELIAHTNHRIGKRNRYICISRPRRFGKTMAAEMLAAYYGKQCDSAELFAPYKLAKCDSYRKYLNQYNVIVLNIQNFLSVTNSVDEMLTFLQKRVISELRRQYPDTISDGESILSLAMGEVYSQKQEGFVFIIDEWDCILRDKRYHADDQKKYLDFIRNLLKDKVYVALAYMTGILPIKKYGTHSALNMFDEYSMTDAGDFQEFVGFTEEEVRALCEQYQVDFDTMQSWYDGYTFPSVPHVYNPKSVVDSIRRKRFGSYWTQTETYEALKIYIDIDYAGLKDDIIRMLSGERVQIHTDRFQNDMTTFESKDDVLTLLVHLGYLAYDSDSSEVFIPNTEIRGEFRNAVTGDYWKDIATALETSDRLLRATWDGDAETVAELLDAAHMENTSILTYNNENSLSCVIAIAYYSAMKDYTKIRELPSGKGFADIVFLPKRFSDKPAMVVELKCDDSADGALAQIREKKYADSLKDYKGKLLLVGINYDKKTKKHDCVIERIEK